MEKMLQSLTTIHKEVETDDDFNIIREFDEYISSYTEYTASGKIKLEKSFNTQNEIQEKIEYRYDEFDRLTEQLMYYDEEEIVEKRNCEYDDNGNLIRLNKHYSEGTFEYTLYFYNNDNQLIEKKSFSHDHEHEETEQFEYISGSLVRESKYNENMKLVYEQKLTREDNVLECETMDIDLGTTRFTEEYNEKGQKLNTHVYDKKNKLISRLIYNYEDAKTVKILEEKSTGTETTIMHYNDHGDVILQEEIDADDFYKSRVTREFDNEFYLLRTQVYINNYGKTPDLNYILKFEYTYYD
jgi:YD repeat-containing protein